MILECVEVGQLQVNCYILAEDKNSAAVLIDPGDEESKIRRILSRFGLTPALIINTHGHIDHIGCDDKFGVPVYIHQNDLKLLRDPNFNLSVFLSSPLTIKSEVKTVEDKDVIIHGKIQLEVIHTPGHTLGGISLLFTDSDGPVLFTGDSLFYRSIGRTDFPGADGKLLLKSIKERLLNFPGETIIYPGHGPNSTIGDEKKYNSFLKDD